MRGLILLALVTLAYAKSIEHSATLTAYGYNTRVAIPLGEKIRKQEEALLKQGALGRIAGGSLSSPGQIPYQAAVLTNYVSISGTGLCGGSLVSANKVIHAAHCWFDGINQPFISEIVLGSTTAFFGGFRQFTSDVVMHPQWDPFWIRNDVAVITLAQSVQFSNTIAPIALPSGAQLQELFDGEIGRASGFGRTGDDEAGNITPQQSLSHVDLNIITNALCSNFYPGFIDDSNICTSGDGGVNICSSDSGGPLAVTRNGQPLLVGVVSFGSGTGCTMGFPSGYARVTSFMSFFNQYL